ncbi:MAG: response regulator transcription factor [Clostridia bacterium]|nr:response regulator transcription factor [Clostridia bacterium]
MSKNKILIIEDEEEIREGLRILLGGESYYSFAEAENGEIGTELLTGDTDLVILDITMPGADGIDLCRRIRQASSVPILILSEKTQDEDILIGLTSGGDDYLTKPFSYAELNARIKALMRRYRVYRGHEENEVSRAPVMIEIDGICISSARNEALIGGRELNLTETEYQILLMLMIKPNRSFSAATLFEKIWKEPFFYGANRTVMLHIKNLRRKIEADPHNPVRIITVPGKGYQFRKKDTPV